MNRTKTIFPMREAPQKIRALIQHLFANPVPETSVVTIHERGDQLLEIEVGAYAVQFAYSITPSQNTAT